MSEESGQEKTEQPTSRRLSKAREQGQIARSRELGTVVLLVGIASALRLRGATTLADLMDVARACWGSAGEARSGDPLAIAAVSGARALLIIAVPLFTVMILGVVTQVAQGGLVFSLKPLTPKLTAFDPRTAMSRLFGRKGGVELARTALAATIAVWIIFKQIQGSLNEAFDLDGASAAGILGFATTHVHRLVLLTGSALSAPALIDYLYQRWSVNKRLKMTKQEVRDEAKDEDGDPMVKGRVAGMRREMLLRRSLAQVPKADVIVTNPTHVAVALRYRSGSMGAPKVVAKGAEDIAARIREIARAHNVPILERPPLARWLYKNVRVGAEIPEAMYKAVAEILAFVYRARGHQPVRTSNPTGSIR